MFALIILYPQPAVNANQQHNSFNGVSQEPL